MSVLVVLFVAASLMAGVVGGLAACGAGQVAPEDGVCVLVPSSTGRRKEDRVKTFWRVASGAVVAVIAIDVLRWCFGQPVPAQTWGGRFVSDFVLLALCVRAFPTKESK